MRTVTASEARAQLSALIELVAQGETVVVTRRGRAVAKLVGLEGGGMTVSEAIDRIRRNRKGSTLGGMTIRDLINEGRKY